MLKTFLIGLKDLKLIFRDRAALVLMLAAPFALILGLGLVTGRFSGNSGSGLADIPVAVVNQDGGELGNALADLFHSAELADLVEPQEAPDANTARRMVDEDKIAAAVIIPAGFTQSIIPVRGQFTDPAALAIQPVKIEVYANPIRSTGAGIVQTIVDEYLSRVDEGRTTGMTSILLMLNSGRIDAAGAEAAGEALRQSLEGNASTPVPAIRIETSTDAPAETDFDPLAYIAPGMALMFLMYTVSYGGRSFLAEKTQGTLPRLLVSPTASAQILGGKVFGVFLTGAAQMLLLLVASFLFFQLKWGDPLAVLILVLAAVFGATGWGMLITAISRSPGQAANLGAALMLIFGVMGGSLISLENMPAFVQTLSRITPNAWALDGFVTLGLGGGLTDIAVPVAALIIMGGALFLVAAVLFRRNPVQA